MFIMKDPVFEDRMQLRTTAVSKLALDRIVANLRASGRVRWKTRKVTQEAIVNAVWLWLETIDPKEVEKIFAFYVPRLESLMRGEIESNEDAPDKPQYAMGQSVFPEGDPSQNSAKKKRSG